MLPPDGVKQKFDGVAGSVPQDRVVNNKRKMTMKILLIVMMPTFC